MSAAQIGAVRSALGMSRDRFWLLGHGIAKSPSPAMHNAGFGACELPHEYAALDVGRAPTSRMKLRPASLSRSGTR